MRQRRFGPGVVVVVILALAESSGAPVVGRRAPQSIRGPAFTGFVPVALPGPTGAALDDWAIP